MRYHLFGRTGLRVSKLFLGAMTFGEQGGVGAPPEECRRMVDAYADAGGNVIDTASNYRGGLSETIVGELLEGRRDRFVLATTRPVRPQRRREPPQEPGVVARDEPEAAANRLHRCVLGAHLGRGARRLDQLLDTLGAADCELPLDAVARLEEAAKFTIGFPSDFIVETESWVFGEAASAHTNPSRRSP
jgi:aryl-alcohol dehydrogenase-like predicted oxidoreductase